ncbi:MAG: serine/threonine-protein kinase [Candidatus Sericytochromatia bacterium]
MSDLSRIPSQSQIQPLPKLNESSRTISNTSLTSVEPTTPRPNPEAFKTTNTNQTPPLPQPHEIDQNLERSSSSSIQGNKSQISQLVLEQEHPTPPLPPKDTSGMNSVSDILKTNFSGIEKGLRGAFKSKSHFLKTLTSNSSLQQQTQTKASRMMQGEVNKVMSGQHSDLIFHLTTKTEKEFRNEVIKSVAGMRDDKYSGLIKQAEENFKPQLLEFERKNAIYNEIVRLKDEMHTMSDTPKGQRDEQWYSRSNDLKQQIQAIYLEVAKTNENGEPFAIFRSESAVIPDMTSIARPVKPELDLYTTLSDNKKGLVDNIILGIKSVEMPNKVVNIRNLDRYEGVPEKVVIGSKEFTLGDFLAAGGGGIIFKATDQEGKEFAVKISNEVKPEIAFTSMVKEGANHYIANMEKNPHILGLEGIVKYEFNGGEQLLMVMELAKGSDLDKLISKTLPELDLPDETNDLILMRNMKDIALGLVDIHNQGLTHLDLKPGNIFLTDEGVAKVADFGEARKGTFSETEIGTPEYMPPEVHDGNREAGQKSDVFSFGMLMYENFLGIIPFKLPDPVNVNAKIDVPERILAFGSDDNNRLINKDNPSVLEQLINRCTHPNPDLRPTMQEVLEHPFFQNPSLETPELRSLIGAVTQGNQNEITRLRDLV